MTASIDDLKAVDEIGERIAQSVVEFFQNERNLENIARLKSYGLQFELSADKLLNQTELLKGKTFVVSGVFETISRNDLKKLIEDNGAKVGSSISSRTSFLVAGDKMGPSKRSRADSLGVPIISEQDFLDMVN